MSKIKKIIEENDILFDGRGTAFHISHERQQFNDHKDKLRALDILVDAIHELTEAVKELNSRDKDERPRGAGGIFY